MREEIWHLLIGGLGAWIIYVAFLWITKLVWVNLPV